MTNGGAGKCLRGESVKSKKRNGDARLHYICKKLTEGRDHKQETAGGNKRTSTKTYVLQMKTRSAGVETKDETSATAKREETTKEKYSH